MKRISALWTRTWARLWSQKPRHITRILPQVLPLLLSNPAQPPVCNCPWPWEQIKFRIHSMSNQNMEPLTANRPILQTSYSVTKWLFEIQVYIKAIVAYFINVAQTNANSLLQGYRFYSQHPLKVPVCRSTTIWQVVASSDPRMETEPILKERNIIRAALSQSLLQ